MKRKQRILWIALSTVAVAALAFGIYVSNYYHATDVALDAFEAKDGIRVKSVDGVFCLEIGVGYNTPGIIKYPFWQQVYQNKNATYACLNMEEEQVPEEIRDRSIVISGDSAQVIQELVS